MSAIYGIVDLNGGDISKKSGDRFFHNYEKYKIDRHEQKYHKNAMFGCAIQYFTREAEAEKLPIVDEKNHIMLVADCVLDNREELRKQFRIDDDTVPDGDLLHQGYLKWGEDCAKHFRGVFSFVVYDWESQKIMLFADQFANRCLFFHERNGILFFSTALFPMIDASGFAFQANERWLVDGITVRGPAMMFEPRETAYADVWKVDAGNYVKIEKRTVEYISYWNPIKTIPTDNSISDAECEMMARKILEESVKNSIRTSGEVAISLSCGLDSTTIAGFAAPILAKRQKKLYAYTSVPLKESNAKNEGYYISDETEGVLEVCKHQSNIVPHFIDCKNRNILNQAEHILDIWELPCKSEQNAVWVDTIREKASQQGCKVMLTGATGNTTLSAGAIEDYVMQSARHFRFIKALKDLRSICRRYGANFKRMAKMICKNEVMYRLSFFRRGKVDYYQNTLTKKGLGEHLELSKRFQASKILNPHPTRSIRKMREEIFFPRAYAQIGEIDTKNSLAYGILERDPLRNVEFIEFCMRLPMRCYVNGKYDRRLVREFMHDIVPDVIRLDVRHRGCQSADNGYRLKLAWKEYRGKMWETLHQEKVLHYLDEQKIQEQFNELTEDNLIEKEMDARLLVDSYMFGKYIEKMYQYIES